ncbi:MAG: M67 family metallopeptidase [Candidatus Dormibacteria bacterium]
MVRLTADAEARLRELAEGAYPHEGCGVLIGRPGEETVVESVTSGRNLVTERSRDRYELDPGDIVAAERLARESNREVLGFWHTHPDHPARPSQFDTDHAWTDYVYIICSVTGGSCDLVRAWSLRDPGGPFEPVDMAYAGAA